MSLLHFMCSKPGESKNFCRIYFSPHIAWIGFMLGIGHELVCTLMRFARVSQWSILNLQRPKFRPLVMNMTMPNLELTARRARSFFAICDVISDVSKFEKWIARQPKRAKILRTSSFSYAKVKKLLLKFLTTISNFSKKVSGHKFNKLSEPSFYNVFVHFWLIFAPELSQFYWLPLKMRKCRNKTSFRTKSVSRGSHSGISLYIQATDILVIRKILSTSARKVPSKVWNSFGLLEPQTLIVI